jgi:hypothetical protein
MISILPEIEEFFVIVYGFGFYYFKFIFFCSALYLRSERRLSRIGSNLIPSREIESSSKAFFNHSNACSFSPRKVNNFALKYESGIMGITYRKANLSFLPLVCHQKC